MIQPTHLLGLPAHLRLNQIETAPQTLILSLAVEPVEAACPLCQQVSHRVHSRYTRTLADLPSAGKALRLLIVVRRFFCENEACPRKIFAERLPELTKVSARRTTRGTETLAELGFALGGKAAAALSQHLGLKSSRMTILRILRQTPSHAVQTPNMLGVDDWAFRRSKTYGTILINLEDGSPVDLLPDRQAATLETWLKNHPGVQLIRRDRGGEFARGAKQGAPEALLVLTQKKVEGKLERVDLRRKDRGHAKRAKNLYARISTRSGAIGEIKQQVSGPNCARSRNCR